ncbi:hypothetical protein HF086_009890 [Spodoptera exigua]|uniref:Midgut protein n=1 Tax=Spodoptera exigua TaxID=7107 RepID=A0A922SAC8_SPOEX|nr:hypothetical protein HF086_009890 [Spodoptera exigua]
MVDSVHSRYPNKMVLKTFILVTLFASYVASDSCVTYDFEEGFNNLFGHYRVCNSMPLWHEGTYNSLNLTSPNVRSTKFISPQPNQISCVSSFNFTMNLGGTIEFNVYLEQKDNLDQFYLIAYHIGPDGIHFIVGMEAVRNQTGWHTVKVPLGGSRSFNGYFSLYGSSFQDSKILVDSFRYIPPGVDESSCQIYG